MHELGSQTNAGIQKVNHDSHICGCSIEMPPSPPKANSFDSLQLLKKQMLLVLC
jgi:hypothetical protein